MARIFYSMAGEGRGHATRVRTVTDHLRERHELTLLAPGDAYELLEKAYRASDVRVQRIPGLRFAYDRKQKVSQLGTAALVARYALALPQIDRELAELMRHHRADLLLTDYDPGGPRAAKRAGVPYVALDHQSFFNFSDLSWLPKKLQHRGAFVARINRFLYHGQRHTISSSFFRPDPLPGVEDRVTFVGSMLRTPILAATPGFGDHVVAYCRRQVQENVLATLAAAPLPVRVFGLGEREPRGAITFEPISEQGFIEALASCRAVVASAGNQLLGEALYLGKPFLALPEIGQYEQEINGHWLERLGAGRAIAPTELTSEVLAAFLDESERFRDAVDRDFAAGNSAAVAAVERQLAEIGAV